MRSDETSEDGDESDNQLERIPEPPLSRRLLVDTRYAWAWLVPRAYLSVAWIGAGVFLLERHVHLTTRTTGVVVELVNGTANEGSPVIWLVLIGCDWAVGLLLGLGAYTGATAFLSLILSCNPVWFGPALTDPLAAGLTVLLVLGWRIAGWYGLDRWFLFDRDLPAYLRARAVRVQEILSTEHRSFHSLAGWIEAKAHLPARRPPVVGPKDRNVSQSRRRR
jgi:thiosulfate dehydrogenase (quinone) large subunit